MKNPKLVNPPRRTARAWVIITLLAAFGMFAPSIFGIDGFDGGFALMFTCGFIIIMGVIIVAIYTARARLLDDILTGKNTMAHWKFSAAEWQAYAEREYQADKQTNLQIFTLIAVISVIVGIILAIANPADAGIFALIILALIAFIGVVAAFATWYRRAQNRHFQGEVYLALDGVYINRQLHTWKGLGARLENAAIEDRYLGQAILVFGYSAPTRNGRDSYTARIPVPEGKLDEARTALEKIRAAHLSRPEANI